MERHYREPGSCPDGGVPLLKPVVAGWGDWVEVSAAGVIVNAKLLPNTKPLVKDSQGRDLARYSGLRRGLWTVSTFDHRSFDSRYFGPIGEAAIRKRLRPWLVVDAASSPAQHKK